MADNIKCCSLVIGPIGCGKSTNGPKAVRGRRFIECDKIKASKTSTKNENIRRDMMLTRSPVAIANGGRIFFTDVKEKVRGKPSDIPFLSGVEVDQVVAPPEMIEMARQMAPQCPPADCSLYNFLPTWKSAWNVMNIALQTIALGSRFVENTKKVCLERLARGEYRLDRYTDGKTIGTFASEESMLQIMTDITEESFSCQYAILVWALKSKITLTSLPSCLSSDAVCSTGESGSAESSSSECQAE